MTNVSLKTYENLLDDYFEACGVYNWEVQPVFPDLNLEGRVYFVTCLIGPYHVHKDSLQLMWFENGRLYTKLPYDEETVDLLLLMRDPNYHEGLDEASYELEAKFKEVFGE